MCHVSVMPTSTSLFACARSFHTLFSHTDAQRREIFRERTPENFLKKLGMNAKVANLRRVFIGKLRKHIPKPPQISAARGRLAKKLEKYKARLRELAKVYKILFNVLSVLILKSREFYVRIKYSIPAFHRFDLFKHQLCMYKTYCMI
jgi:hypothetical protein